jgi:hypothetical protein
MFDFRWRPFSTFQWSPFWIAFWNTYFQVWVIGGWVLPVTAVICRPGEWHLWLASLVMWLSCILFIGFGHLLFDD